MTTSPNPTHPEAITGPLVETVVNHFLSPVDRSEPVVRLAGVADLVEAFASSVGLEMELGEAAHDGAQLHEAVRTVIEYSIDTRHPRFVNQNWAGADPIGVVGDWIGSLLNTTNATWEVAPVFTAIENAVLRTLAEIAGYPASKEGPPPGILTPGGATSILYALSLARHRHDPDAKQTGGSPQLAILVSESAHYASRKSASMLGLGTDAVIKVASDANGAMLLDDVAPALERARSAGRTPFVIVATAGTTTTSAFDPIADLAAVCEAEGLWLHVDGAYGGSALFSDQHRHRLAGVERSDSFTWNMHKMAGITQQCATLLVREPDLLEECFGSGASYLFQPDKLHTELDTGDRTFQCGRRPDAIKFWLVWKARGAAWFGNRVDHVAALGDHARARIAESSGEFHAVIPGDFTNVCVTWVPPELRPLDPDDLSAEHHELLDQVAPLAKQAMQRDGIAMIGYQPVGGRNCFRLIFINPEVTTADVDDLLALIAHHSADAWADITS